MRLTFHFPYGKNCAKINLVLLCKQTRALWRHYLRDTHGLTFVVDSSDRERISEARNELHRILSDVSKLIISEKIICLLVNMEESFTIILVPLMNFTFWIIPNSTLSMKTNFCIPISILQNELSNAALLVFANKQDLPNVMPAAEVADKLELYSLGQRRW